MTKQHEEYMADQLTVKIFNSRDEMGIYAAAEVAGKIEELLSEYDHVNMVFAAAPSQNEFLDALSRQPGISWNRVNAFHMDEYIDLPRDHPQRFGNFLRERIFDKVAFNNVYFMNDNGHPAEMSCENYARLLQKHAPDIVCMGIGENTHIAFNDPHVADFNDPALVKLVDLDEVSRQQQVNDGCFTAIADVPERAMTLTVPALMKARHVYCIVPGVNKSEAVYHTLNDKVNEKHPSTTLRRHPHAILYLDKESAAKLNKGKGDV